MNKDNFSTESTVHPHEWKEVLNVNIRQLGTSTAMQCAKKGAGPFGANHPGLCDDEFVPMVSPMKPLPDITDSPTAALLKNYESILEFNNTQKRQGLSDEKAFDKLQREKMADSTDIIKVINDSLSQAAHDALHAKYAEAKQCELELNAVKYYYFVVKFAFLRKTDNNSTNFISNARNLLDLDQGKKSIGVFRRELIASVERVFKSLVFIDPIFDLNIPEMTLRFEPVLAMMALEGAANCEALAARYAEQANMGNDTIPVTLDAMFAAIAREQSTGTSAKLVNANFAKRVGTKPTGPKGVRRACFACLSTSHVLGDCPIVKEIQEKNRAQAKIEVPSKKVDTPRTGASKVNDKPAAKVAPKK